MTPEQLAEIAARLDAATPGPWVQVKDIDAYAFRIIPSSIGRPIAMVNILAPDPVSDLHNAALIAHAPTDLRALLDEVERLTEERDEALGLLASASKELAAEGRTRGEVEAERNQLAVSLLLLR